MPNLYVPYSIDRYNNNISYELKKIKLNNRKHLDRIAIYNSDPEKNKENKISQEEIIDKIKALSRIFKINKGIEIHLKGKNNEEYNPIHDGTQSILLGLYIKLKQKFENFKINDEWATITITGDIDIKDNKIDLAGVDEDEISKKYKDYKNDKQINFNDKNIKNLFIYVSDEEDISIKPEKNIEVEYFSPEDHEIEDVLKCLSLKGKTIRKRKIISDNDFECEVIDNNQLKIIKYTGNKKIVNVPDNIQGLRVCILGREALRENGEIKEIIIADSILYIESGAFLGCSSLKKVKLPNSLSTIKQNLFQYCGNLMEIIIPKHVRRISVSAFNICNKLSCIIVDKENREYADKEGILYNKEMFTLIKYPAGKHTGEVKIPNTVVNIGACAFFCDNNIRKVILHDSLATIGKGAFIFCGKLSSITIPSSVKHIGKLAFYNCASLHTVYMGINTNYEEEVFPEHARIVFYLPIRQKFNINVNNVSLMKKYFVKMYLANPKNINIYRLSLPKNIKKWKKNISSFEGYISAALCFLHMIEEISYKINYEKTTKKQDLYSLLIDIVKLLGRYNKIQEETTVYKNTTEENIWDEHNIDDESIFCTSSKTLGIIFRYCPKKQTKLFYKSWNWFCLKIEDELNVDEKMYDQLYSLSNIRYLIINTIDDILDNYLEIFQSDETLFWDMIKCFIAYEFKLEGYEYMIKKTEEICNYLEINWQEHTRKELNYNSDDEIEIKKIIDNYYKINKDLGMRIAANYLFGKKYDV